MSQIKAYLIAVAITIACFPVAFAATWLLEGMPNLAALAADDWAARSVKVCGPGYLSFVERSGGTRTGFTYNPVVEHGRYCVPYKLPLERSPDGQ